MDATTISLIIVAVICIAAFLIYRGKIKIGLTDAIGNKLELEGSNESKSSSTGVNIQRAKAGRDIKAMSKTGSGVNLNKVEADQDIIATSEHPSEASGPKA